MVSTYSAFTFNIKDSFNNFSAFMDGGHILLDSALLYMYILEGSSNLRLPDSMGLPLSPSLPQNVTNPVSIQLFIPSRTILWLNVKPVHFRRISMDYYPKRAVYTRNARSAAPSLSSGSYTEQGKNSQLAHCAQRHHPSSPAYKVITPMALPRSAALLW